MVKMAFRSSAERDLARLARPLRRTILGACRDIFDDWAIGKSLTGPLAGYRMYRMGVYRIIYAVRGSSSIEIVAIGHRKDIYEWVS
ncbi:type II toxin-antitoxin system RelE/ParE family toxin [Candidatus Uhrbacteria bacterium]|nr:type II toxin-antitoxin system RelE/ParE family toxin [Candidatus Uhrbacteria bacterium]